MQRQRGPFASTPAPTFVASLLLVSAACVVLLQPLQGAHAARQGVFDLYSYELEFTAAPVWDSTETGGNRNLDVVIVLAFRHPETNQQVRIRGNSASGRNAGVTPFSVGIGGNANGFNKELAYATIVKQGNATQPPFVLRSSFDDIIIGYNETVAVYGGDFEFNGEQPGWHDAGDSDFIEIYPIIILDVSPEVCNYSTTDKLYTCADKTTFNVPYPGMPNAFDSADGIVYEPYGITVRFTFNCQQDSDCGNNATCTNGECLCDAGYFSEVGDGYDCRELCDEMNDCPGENSVCDRTATEVGVCMCTDESLVLLETNYCTTPVTCNAGEYQTITEDGSMLECSPCPAGFFCPGTNNAARLCTPISTYSMEGASMCMTTPPGSFSVADSVTLDVTDIGDGQTPEYVGSYSEEVAFTIIYTSIDTCPAGSRCSGGVMEPCVDGMTYQGQPGQSVCEDCSACDDGFEVAQACNRTHNTVCVDVDECTTTPGICGTGGTCENIDGGFVCDCSEGYENDNDNNGICVNIDECDVDPDICGPTNAICRDTDGSYTCECFGGYALNEETNMCEDIDECAAANDCDSIDFSTCVNLPGAYRCDCNDTFVESMRTGPTSVQCVCAEGFSPQGDPATCQDVDECEAANDCDSIDFSTCVNTVGAYRCDCDDTFVESMRSSATSVTCSCEDGFSPQGDPATCENVNECMEGTDDCATALPNSVCVDTIGSFECECAEGFVFDQEEDECMNIPPAIELLGPEVLTLEVGVSYYMEYGAIATDNGVSVHYTIDGVSDVLDAIAARNLGTYDVTYMAIDNMGDSAMVTRSVVIEDSTPPVMTLKRAPFYLVELPVGDITPLFAASSWVDVSDLSNEEIVPVPSITLNALLMAAQGVQTTSTMLFSFSATDSSDNSASVNITIQFLDANAPSLNFSMASSPFVAVELTVPPEEAGNVEGSFLDDLFGYDAVAGTLMPSITGTDTLVLNAITSANELAATVRDFSGHASRELIRYVAVEDTLPPTVAFAAPQGVANPEDITLDAGDSLPTWLGVDGIEVMDASSTTRSRTPSSLSLMGNIGDRVELLRYTVSDIHDNYAPILTSRVAVRDRPAMVEAVLLSANPVSRSSYTIPFGGTFNPPIMSATASASCVPTTTFSASANPPLNRLQFSPGTHLCVYSVGEGHFAQITEVRSYTVLYPSRNDIVRVRIEPQGNNKNAKASSSSSLAPKAAASARDELQIQLNDANQIGFVGSQLQNVDCQVFHVADVSGSPGMYDADVVCFGEDGDVARSVTLSFSPNPGPNDDNYTVQESTSGASSDASLGIIVLAILIVLGLIIAGVIFWKRPCTRRDKSGAGMSQTDSTPMTMNPAYSPRPTMPSSNTPAYSNMNSMPLQATSSPMYADVKEPTRPSTTGPEYSFAQPRVMEPTSAYAVVRNDTDDKPPAVAPKRGTNSNSNSNSNSKSVPVMMLQPTSEYATVSDTTEEPPIAETKSLELGPRKNTNYSRPTQSSSAKPVLVLQGNGNKPTQSGKPAWQFGAISRAEAEEHLKGQPLGAFLVREKGPGNFVISVGQSPKVVHHNVVMKPNGFEFNGTFVESDAKDPLAVIAVAKKTEGLVKSAINDPISA